MTKDHWHRAKSMLEDIVDELDSLKEAVPAKYHDNVRACTDEVDVLADAIYTVCEDDYYDECNRTDLSGYEEAIASLPPGNTLSAEEIQRLITHIENWKQGN